MIDLHCSHRESAVVTLPSPLSEVSQPDPLLRYPIISTKSKKKKNSRILGIFDLDTKDFIDFPPLRPREFIWSGIRSTLRGCPVSRPRSDFLRKMLFYSDEY